MRDPVSSSDPYAILGLGSGATMPEVKRAYRRLAKAYHPDSAGDAATARFLAIHAAYESIRTGRPMLSTRGSGAAGGDASGGSTAAEPWRADPERARAARERARHGPGARARPSGTSGTAGRTGPAAGRPGATGTSGTASGGATGKSRGRRHVRKATMGSTSYDDARDANDATWSGASWYGPSTGEYWIVNPREYADPRKHGPEYQSRARRMAAAAAAAASEGRPVDDPDYSFDSEGPDDAEFRPGTRARVEPDGEPPFDDRAAQAGPSLESDRPDRARWAPRGAVRAGAALGGAAADGDWGATTSREIRRSRASGSGSLRSPRDWLGGPADDPIRRLGITLLAWPPLGLGAAAVIGQVTGCGAYSAACDGAEPLLPWLAQAGILGLLLLLPPAARVLAGGTIAILLALAPVTAFLVAVGGSGAPQAGFALTFFLVIAWLAGITWGAVAQLRRPGARAAP